MALSGDGRMAVSASAGQHAEGVGGGQRARTGTLAGHTGGVTGVALSGDGQIAVSASQDNTLKVWELGAGANCAPSPATRCGQWRGVESGRADWRSPRLRTTR